MRMGPRLCCMIHISDASASEVSNEIGCKWRAHRQCFFEDVACSYGDKSKIFCHLIKKKLLSVNSKRLELDHAWEQIMVLPMNIFYAVEFSCLWCCLSLQSVVFVYCQITRKAGLKCRCLGTTLACYSRVEGPRTLYFIDLLNDFYLMMSESLCFVVCVCLGILYEGCEGYAPVASQDEQGSKKQKWWPAKLFKPMAWDKENAFTVPRNYNFSVCI